MSGSLNCVIITNFPFLFSVPCDDEPTYKGTVGAFGFLGAPLGPRRSSPSPSGEGEKGQKTLKPDPRRPQRGGSPQGDPGVAAKRSVRAGSWACFSGCGAGRWLPRPVAAGSKSHNWVA